MNQADPLQAHMHKGLQCILFDVAVAVRGIDRTGVASHSVVSRRKECRRRRFNATTGAITGRCDDGAVTEANNYKGEAGPSGNVEERRLIDTSL